MIRKLRGHLWTIGPTLRQKAKAFPVPPGQPWHATVPPELERRLTGIAQSAGRSAEANGAVSLSGIHHQQPDAKTLVILVHGLAGSPDSYYIRRAAAVVWSAGQSVLRIALRGADRSGEDLYHGGQTIDLHAALAHQELAGYDRVLIIGYSMGGHAALRLAAEDCDPRLGGVAAICSPLDLELTQQHMDRSGAAIYRRYLLRQMNEIYAAAAQRHGGPIPTAEARRIDSFLEWDDRVIAPWFGFRDARDYYARASAARALQRLRLPSLLVVERMDPMIPPHTLEPALERANPHLEVCWVDKGGHVGFPSVVDLGMGAPGRLESQVLDWLLARPR